MLKCLHAYMLTCLLYSYMLICLHAYMLNICLYMIICLYAYMPGITRTWYVTSMMLGNW